jgi:hypothetical protein
MVLALCSEDEKGTAKMHKNAKKGINAPLKG